MSGRRSRTTVTLYFLIITFSGLPFKPALAQEDVADVSSKRYKLDDKRLRYYVIGAQEKLKAPEEGFKVLFVLPGGDGSDDFLPFVKRIWKYALDEDYLVVQLVAPKWSRRQQIIWPIGGSRVAGMKVTTEEFLRSALSDLRERVRLDERHVFALGWSSGGPAVFAASLEENSPLAGSFVAMSVFHPGQYGDLDRAAGHAYYLLHSKQDHRCPYRMAALAERLLRQKGAAVKLTTYDGGHGWHGNVFGQIRNAVAWLEEQAADSGDDAED